MLLVALGILGFQTLSTNTRLVGWSLTVLLKHLGHIAPLR